MTNSAKNRKPRKTRSTSWIYETFTLPNPDKGERLECDGPLEHDFLLTQLFEKDVEYIDSRPQSFISEATGERYTRDAVTAKQDLKLKHYEIKSKEALKKPKTKKKFDALAEEFKAQNEEFLTLTEDDIREGDLILNLKQLHKYLYCVKPSKDKIEAILTVVESESQYTFGEMFSACKTNPFNMRDVWYCLAHKHLLTDLTRRITFKSIIWSKRHEI